MAGGMFTADQMDSEVAQKIIGRLKEFGTIQQNTIIELLFGTIFLGKLVSTCLICTDKEIILFDNIKNRWGFFNKKIYPHGSITGYYVETALLSQLYLYLGGIEKIRLEYSLAPTWCDALTAYLDTKIKK